MAKRRAVRRLDHPWDLSAWKGRFAVGVLVICLFLALAAGLVAIYTRLSPLQAVQDERTARQGVQEGRGRAVVTEGEELLKGLRSLVKELTGTVHLERVIANERRAQLDAERAASEALRAQLNAERFASQALCAQLNAERVDLLDTLYRAFGPARVDQAVEEINARRACAKRERAQSEEPAALTGDEQPERARTTTLPTTPEDETDEERESQRDTELILPLCAPKPGNDDGEATEVIDQEALLFALRPLVHEGLRGFDDVPESAPGRRLGPDEETPRKYRLTALEAGK